MTDLDEVLVGEVRSPSPNADVLGEAARATLGALLSRAGHPTEVVDDILANLKPGAFVVDGHIDGAQIDRYAGMVCPPKVVAQ